MQGIFLYISLTNCLFHIKCLGTSTTLGKGIVRMNPDQLRILLTSYVETLRRISDGVPFGSPPSEDIRRRACSRLENQVRTAEIIPVGMFTEAQRNVLEIVEGDTVIELMNGDHGVRSNQKGWVDDTVYQLSGLPIGDLSQVFEDDSLWWVAKVLTREGHTMFLRSATAGHRTTYKLCIIARG